MEVAVLGTLIKTSIGHVIQKLAGFLKEELQIQTEARRSIDSIRDQLEIVQARLSEVQDNRPILEEFSSNLRELSYDIEDLVDELLLESTVGKSSKKKYLAQYKNNRQIVKRLHKAKSRLEEVSSNMHKLLPGGDGPYGRVTLQAASSQAPAFDADASSLVGMDGPREELAKLLIEEDPESASRLKVICIVGFGGLGKTTLAKEVYSTTKEYFGCDAWVSVSRNPNMMNILVGILRQVEDPDITRAEGEGDERYLIGKIRESLQAKRYLIVVDDIWSIETWDIIKSALPPNHFGSRIITTTRKQSVAESCCSHWNDHVYNLKPLSEMDSKELFLRRIFGSSDSCPPHLEDVSHKILKKCSGLPLAITAMSGLLTNKQHIASIWDEVYKSLSGIPETMEGAENIFLISYYGLPYHLKTCLLYLSLFPEDYMISRDLIISLWIAEGFILGNHGRTPEEVGQSYLDELINRKMIQPIHGYHDGKPEAYILHGMVLDFVKSKAAEENFVTILENEEPVSKLPDKIRRVSIINNVKDHYIPASMAKSHIRALSIFGSVGPKISFKQMTVLRVFHLEGCKNLENHSIKEIAGLLNLRHLSIRDTPITELPDQIGELRNLTTLDVRGTEVKELPVSVVRLQRLTHLHCDKMRLPEWIGKMVALSCLLQFDIFQSKMLAVQELGKLSELKQLVLWWSPDLQSDNTERYEYFATSLYRLNKLQSLAIHGSDTSVDILDYLRHRLWHLHRIHVNNSCYLNRIAEWLGSLPKLEYICIDIKQVANKDLMLLSQLPTLIHLSLSSKAMPTEKLVISSSGFPVLQEFQLHSAKADLTFESQAMQKLEILLLSLHVLPEEKYVFSIKIDQFTCLKKFDLRINGKGAPASQFFADADAAIRKATDGHPKRPTVEVILLGNLIDYAAKQGKENEQKLEAIQEK